MAYSSMTTRAAGYVVKAATDWNVMIANFNAIWVGTTAGDLDYYTSATAKSRLALTVGGLLYGGASAPAWLAPGAVNNFLRSTGGSLGWSPLVYQRQGGSSTIWTSPGTTGYTPTATVIQVGYVSIAVSSGGTNSAAITYPTAFTQRPAIFLTTEQTGALGTTWALGHTDDTVNGFTLHLKFTSTSQTGTYTCGWLAIGL
jgi:hypothetical protein